MTKFLRRIIFNNANSTAEKFDIKKQHLKFNKTNQHERK